MENEFKLQVCPNPRLATDAEDFAFWPTPRWPTIGLLQQFPPLVGYDHIYRKPIKSIVEPSAGKGGIAEVLVEHDYRVHLVEVRQECETDLLKYASCSPGSSVDIMDWLDWRWFASTRLKRPFGIIGNPPYNPNEIMLRHVEHALSPAVGADYVALMLPMTFLCTIERSRFWKAHPLSWFCPLVPRPVTTEKGGGGGLRDLAWYIWAEAYGFDARIRIVNRDEVIANL